MLRSINPSPYLFYFDYGDFKIFGSSPEAQIVVSNNKAEIHPIAGTFKRTGDDSRDAKKAEKQNKTQEEVTEAMEKTIPLGRYGEPEEFAKVATFLVSGANTYLTGQTILVDGGMVKAY